MKKQLVLTCLLAAATPRDATADEPSFGVNCALVGVTAELIMEMRQLGAPMAEMMDRFEDGSIQRMMVMEAYHKGRFTSGPVQRRAIEDFRDQWALRCFEANET